MVYINRRKILPKETKFFLILNIFHKDRLVFLCFLVLTLRGNARNSFRKKTAFMISRVSHKQTFLIKALKSDEM